ncbi:sigma 54-interacting transcriptional regulator [Flavonifractor plautii]|nr:sigma 54-interacting transcriptional regulator [Flavonifractor plautii]
MDELHAFQRENLDFHEIVEHVDHSIFVTDGEGNVLYVNPAYSQNTNVQPEDVLGRNVFDIVQEGRIFTGGASCDVIQNRKRVFRLSTTYKTDPPLMGYTVGVPVFNRDGSLSKVVVSSRPLSTLKLLQGDFEQFLHNLEEIRKREPVSSVNENSSTLEARPMIGHSKALNGIWEKIRHVAASDATVLITGESGVGKEVVADEVYRHSLRNNRPYIKVNCAAIPASLLESELFGYDKGAFSGASAGKASLNWRTAAPCCWMRSATSPGSPGQAAARHPEPGDHPGWQYQGKASGHPFSLTDQQQPAGKGRRRDLPQRPFLPAQRYSHPDPPLRARPEDIPELVEHFLEIYRRKYQRSITLTPKSMDILTRYRWPGNVRELENALEYLALCCPEGDVVQESVVLDLLRQDTVDEALQPVSTLGDAVSHYEKP